METNPITDQELQAIRERCEKATPEPWGVEQTSHALWIGVMHGEKVYTIVAHVENHPLYKTEVVKQHESDADFIAHARTDLPRLADEIIRLRKENAELKKRVEIGARLYTSSALILTRHIRGCMCEWCKSLIAWEQLTKGSNNE